MSPTSRPRRIFGLIICWLPFVAVVVTALSWWSHLADGIPTQWSGGEVSTVAPAWTALLLPLGGTLICGILATMAALDVDGRGVRKVYSWTFGAGVVLVGGWLWLMVPNL